VSPLRGRGSTQSVITSRADGLEGAYLDHTFEILVVVKQGPLVPEDFGSDRVLEGVLTPGLRLRILAEEIRRDIGPMDDAQEAEMEREIDETVREARRSMTRGR